MCWFCGGRCLLCGEPSEFVWVMADLDDMYACVEHRDEVGSQAQVLLDRLYAAPWN